MTDRQPPPGEYSPKPQTTRRPDGRQPYRRGERRYEPPQVQSASHVQISGTLDHRVEVRPNGDIYFYVNDGNVSIGITVHGKEAQLSMREVADHLATGIDHLHPNLTAEQQRQHREVVRQAQAEQRSRARVNGTTPASDQLARPDQIEPPYTTLAREIRQQRVRRVSDVDVLKIGRICGHDLTPDQLIRIRRRAATVTAEEQWRIEQDHARAVLMHEESNMGLIDTVAFELLARMDQITDLVHGEINPAAPAQLAEGAGL